MNVPHGIRGVAVAAAAAVSGAASPPDHAITVAVIVASGGITAAFISACATAYLNGRRERKAARTIDHQAEAAAEQLALAEHRVMESLLAEVERLTKENERLRRDRR